MGISTPLLQTFPRGIVLIWKKYEICKKRRDNSTLLGPSDIHYNNYMQIFYLLLICTHLIELIFFILKYINLIIFSQLFLILYFNDHKFSIDGCEFLRRGTRYPPRFLIVKSTMEKAIFIVLDSI